MADELVLLTADEAAKMIRLSSKSVRALVAEGLLKAVRLGPKGGKVMFLREDLLDYVQRARGMASAGLLVRPSPASSNRQPKRNAQTATGSSRVPREDR